MDNTILILALSIVRAAVKNPKKKAKLRRVLLQIRDAIDAAYAID